MAMEHLPGPIRIRGARSPYSSLSGPTRARTLHALVQELRTKSGHMPITVVVHGWGRLTAYEFLNFLSSSLDLEEDAIWLVPDKQPEGTFPYPEESAILLDMTRDTDLRIYRNLVADIVFFPAESEEGPEQVRQFQSRAHVALIAEKSPQQNAVRNAACAAMLAACLWSGENTVNECGEGERGPSSPEPLKPQAVPDLEEIGKTLLESAVELQRHPYRRYQFQLHLQEVLNAYPGHPNWYEDLARQADKHGWPPWAVHCVPKFYIPLPDPSPGRKAAIVWRYVLDCAPDPQGYEAKSLCGGELYEATTTPQVADLLATVAQKIEEHLHSNPYSGDTDFNGSVIDALQEIERSLRQQDLSAADKLREVQRRFYTETRVTPL